MANNSKSGSFFVYFRDFGQFQTHARSLNARTGAGKPGDQKENSRFKRSAADH